MLNDQKIRFGLIGAGGIAKAYSAAIKQIPAADLVGVADVDFASAQRLAEEHDAVAFGDHEELKAAEVADAVIVCTPPLYHPEHCIDFLKCGVHVLCEKPLAIDSASAVDMSKAAQVGDALFTMASKFRFMDDVNHAKQLVDQGQLGQILLYENCFTGIVDMSKRWNSDPEIAGGGVLIDNGTHSLDIMRYFLGSLAEIRVVEGNRIQNLPVEDTVHVFVRSNQGTLGCIDLSWSLHKDVPYFINLYGSEGTVQVGWRRSRLKMKGDSQWSEFGTGYDKIECFRKQLENFRGAILTREPLVISPQDGIASVCIVEAAYQAMQNNSWQPVDYVSESKV